ncbi:MAG: hypothetical protein R3F59_04115 [Myxococcota bacterium]
MAGEAVVTALVIGIVVGSGIAALPWTNGEIRGSVRAFATLAALPALAVLAVVSRRLRPSEMVLAGERGLLAGRR